ncbi:MAG: sulfite exporter TauE/SafE family protein, partial [Rhodospirillales bacterium]|nr:sulfite exporter TauE/SafE family protein [Rhodospirillales bacterium]
MDIYLPIAEMSVNVLLILGLGGMVGFLSGLFGVGGGFLMTPLLFFIGIPPAVAVATEANQIIASSVSGVIAHWRRGNVDFKMGVILLLGGFAGSSAGVWLFTLLRQLGQIDLVIRLSFVLFLGVIGMLMLIESLRAMRGQKAGVAHSPRPEHTWRDNLPFKIRFRRSRLYISVLLPLGV